MSFTSMITGASLPLTDPASLFKNPAATGITAFNSATNGLTLLGSSMTAADSTFDPSAMLTQMSTASTAITTELTSKVAKLGTELPLAVAAAGQVSTAQAVDALQAGIVGNIPDQISKSFALNGDCPNDIVGNAFKSITGAPALIAGKMDAIATSFSNTGPMSSLFISLNTIPGVAVTTGKDLLTFLGNIPAGLQASVTTVVNATVSANPSLLAGLKTSFNSVTSTVTSMTSEFNGFVATSTAGVQNALNTVIGNNTISLMRNSNPCIQKVMSACINPANVDNTALGLYDAINAKTISLPGQEAVTAIKSGQPITLDSPVNKPLQSAAAIIAPLPGKPTIQPYTSDQLQGFLNQLVAQSDVVGNNARVSGQFYKDNIETWKTSVDYDTKKSAVSPTVTSPYGTQGDQAALDTWKIVYDQWVPRRDQYNNTYVPQNVAAKKKLIEIRDELSYRQTYGKYPYTYSISAGMSVTDDKQYTYLDSTK